MDCLSPSGTNNAAWFWLSAGGGRLKWIPWGSDVENRRAHVTPRMGVVLYGYLRLLGSPEVLSGGTGNPHYVEKSLMWTVQPSGHRCGQDGGMKSDGEGWALRTPGVSCRKAGYGSLDGEEHGDHTGQHIQRLSLDIRAALPLECLHTCYLRLSLTTDVAVLWDRGTGKLLAC